MEFNGLFSKYVYVLIHKEYINECVYVYLWLFLFFGFGFSFFFILLLFSLFFLSKKQVCKSRISIFSDNELMPKRKKSCVVEIEVIFFEQSFCEWLGILVFQNCFVGYGCINGIANLFLNKSVGPDWIGANVI